MDKVDFALQWLDRQDVEIYNKDKRIFLFDGKSKYKVKRLQTSITLSEEDFEEDETTIMPYEELLNYKYGVKLDPTVKYVPRSRGSYEIIRLKKNTSALSYDAFRKACQQTNMHIQHDPKELRIRLIGDNVKSAQDKPDYSGVGKWVHYDQPEEEEYYNKFSLHDENNEEKDYSTIEGIPVLITKEKYIVCVKKENVVQRWIVVGESRYGKSLLTSALASRIFYMFEDCVGWLIDPMNQFFNLSLPQSYKEFIKLNSWINNPPMPVPAIHLYMASKNMIKPPHKNISMILTLSFFEFMNKYQYYTYGTDELKIPGSITYLKERAASLQNVKTINAFKEKLLKTIDPRDKNAMPMLNKWVSRFEIIFKEKFTSNLYQDTPTATEELEVRFGDGKKEKEHPFIMAMIAGLVPVINAAGCHQQVWFKNYLADLMNKVIEYQMKKPRENRQNMYLIVDELNAIHEKGRRRDMASEMIERIFRQGAFNNIGFVGNTQSLEKLNPEIYKNASHIACVYMKDPKDRKRLRDTFGVDKDVDPVQRSLKKGEIMVFSKEPFIVYDRYGRNKSHKFEDKLWFKGRIFPPVNHHEMPKRKN